MRSSAFWLYDAARKRGHGCFGGERDGINKTAKKAAAGRMACSSLASEWTDAGRSGRWWGIFQWNQGRKAPLIKLSVWCSIISLTMSKSFMSKIFVTPVNFQMPLLRSSMQRLHRSAS